MGQEKISRFGRLNTATIRKCAKQKALAKALILVYIDQRAKLDWVFNVPDMISETGITEKTVKLYVRELLQEGVLKKVPPADYTKKMNSRVVYYRLDKAEYEKQYWTEQDDQCTPETGEGVTIPASNHSQDGGNEYLAKGVTIPGDGGNYSDEGGNGCLAEGVTAPVYKENIKEEKKSEKNTDIQTRPSVCPFHTPLLITNGAMASPSQAIPAAGTDRPADDGIENKARSTRLGSSGAGLASPDSVQPKGAVKLSSGEGGSVLAPSSPPADNSCQKENIDSSDRLPSFFGNLSEHIEKLLDQKGLLTGNEPVEVLRQKAGSLFDKYGEDGIRASYRRMRSDKRQELRDRFEEMRREHFKKCKMKADRKEYFSRCSKYRSPLGEQAEDPTISAAEKVKALEAALLSLSRIGYYDGKFRHDLEVVYDKRSLAKAQEFFDLNPQLSVSDLMAVQYNCIQLSFENPVQEGEFDEYYIERIATKLHILLKNLQKINSRLTGTVRLPPWVMFLEMAGSNAPEDADDENGKQ